MVASLEEDRRQLDRRATQAEAEAGELRRRLEEVASEAHLHESNAAGMQSVQASEIRELQSKLKDAERTR